jgi:uncharacterized protein YgbK (DUF1537 family)
MNDLRILADDLTGALDSAAAFAGDVPVFLDIPQPQVVAASVSVVATATRDMPIESLPTQLGPSISWLAAGRVSFKKIDSLLRGNTFAEAALTARTGGFKRVVFAPAFRRTPVGGTAGQTVRSETGRRRRLTRRRIYGAGPACRGFAERTMR